MKTTKMREMEDFTLVVEGREADITGIYCADLLSWAMGRAPAGCAWCTVMGNVNAVAVAALADMAVMVLCEGARLDPDAEARARTEGINIATTPLPAFEAGVKIARAAGVATL